MIELFWFLPCWILLRGHSVAPHSAARSLLQAGVFISAHRDTGSGCRTRLLRSVAVIGRVFARIELLATVRGARVWPAIVILLAVALARWVCHGALSTRSSSTLPKDYTPPAKGASKRQAVPDRHAPPGRVRSPAETPVVLVADVLDIHHECMRACPEADARSSHGSRGRQLAFRRASPAGAEDARGRPTPRDAVTAYPSRTRSGCISVPRCAAPSRPAACSRWQ